MQLKSNLCPWTFKKSPSFYPFILEVSKATPFLLCFANVGKKDLCFYHFLSSSSVSLRYPGKSQPPYCQQRAPLD